MTSHTASATNRRSYMMELVSTENESMGQVGFLYGESSWNHRRGVEITRATEGSPAGATGVSSDMRILPRPVAATTEVEPQIITVDPIPVGHSVVAKELDFGYRLTGDRVAWRPVRVYDDGVKTYIDFNMRRLSGRELPSLVVNDVDSIDAMINYRFLSDSGRIVVDGLFDQASLILGVGRKQSRVRISRAHRDHTTAN